MSDSSPNIVVFVSDQHAARVTGVDGHDRVETPNIDRIAANGIRFPNTYCSSPVCVPSRLSFFTGRHIHEIGAWDQQASLPAEAQTWGDLLPEYESVLCGRSHPLGDDCAERTGFDRRPLDNLDRWKNQLFGGAPNRDPPGPDNRRHSRSHVTDCGIDDDHWQLAYDRTAARIATDFIAERGRELDPWLLYVGTINPHFPLRAPQRLVARYDTDARPKFSDIPLAPTHDEPLEEQHPYVRQIRRYFRNDTPLDPEIEREALASYYALVTFTDELVGQVYNAIQTAGLADETVFIYTSDHGEMAGHHGHWQKQTMYNPSVRVPMVASGPGIPEATIETNANLVDLTPTLLDIAGVEPDPDLPGRSIRDLATTTPAGVDSYTGTGRPVLSQYHHAGSTGGVYMLAKGKYKYVHYVNHPPQLFNLDADPDETNNLAADPDYRAIRTELEAELLDMLDPDAVDEQAKADQRYRREQVISS